MTAKIEVLPLLDPIAFVLALICAPVLVAVVGFAIFFIPVFALVFGGPVYLIVGTPILLWMVTRFPPDAKVFACAGFLANCALIVGLGTWHALAGVEDPNELIGMALCGLIFAPLWGAVFARLYRHWYRPLHLDPAL